jgi:hypothetical protein
VVVPVVDTEERALVADAAEDALSTLDKLDALDTLETLDALEAEETDATLDTLATLDAEEDSGGIGVLDSEDDEVGVEELLSGVVLELSGGGGVVELLAGGVVVEDCEASVEDGTEEIPAELSVGLVEEEVRIDEGLELDSGGAVVSDDGAGDVADADDADDAGEDMKGVVQGA